MIGIIDTSISSLNLGDNIIMDWCNNVLHDVLQNQYYIRIPRHVKIDKQTKRIIEQSNKLILCWTNALKSPILIKNFFRNFNYSILKNKIILMWVWWGKYQDNIDWLTRYLLKYSLDKEHIHSVRDSYTLEKLNKIWINNVVNTSCPSLRELKNKIYNNNKQKNVIFTITCYSKNPQADKYLIKILKKTYENLFFWPQQVWDSEYIDSLWIKNWINFINPNIDSYNKLLEQGNIDYVWTRLHGWIRAIQKWIRAIIISIDNRTQEMSKDIWLLSVWRENLDNLDYYINNVFDTKLTIPIKNIDLWKSQFKTLWTN